MLSSAEWLSSGGLPQSHPASDLPRTREMDGPTACRPGPNRGGEWTGIPWLIESRGWCAKFLHGRLWSEHTERIEVEAELAPGDSAAYTDRVRLLIDGYQTSRNRGRDVLADIPASHVVATIRAVVVAIGLAGRTEGGSWLALLEALLVVLRLNTDCWPHDLATDFDAATDLFAEFQRIVAGGGVTVGPDRAAEIGVVIDTVLGQLGVDDELDGTALLVAHKLAQVIDGERNETFADWLKAGPENQLAIEPGRIYPVARDDPRRWMQSSANTRADTLPTARPEDAIVHARLGTDDHRSYRLVLDWSLDGRLASLLAASELRIATFHANESLADFDIVCDKETRMAANNGPADTQRLLARYAAMARRAKELGANVVVVPEYTLNSQDRGRFAAEFAAEGFRPDLVAAGSARVGAHNEGCVMVFSGGGVPVGKTFNKVHAARLGPFREDIECDRPPEVPVWRIGAVALAVLICRDAQDKRLIDLLVEAGVNLCLVPSFSDRRSTIIGLSERFATETQGFVAVAIAPQRASLADLPAGCRPSRVVDAGAEIGVDFEEGDGDSDDLPETVEAFFKGPYGDDTRSPAVWAPSELTARAPGPGIWLFESRRAQASWSGV